MTRPDVAHIREAVIAARDITAARDARLAYARPAAQLRAPADHRLLAGALAVALTKAGVEVGQWEEELAKTRTGSGHRLEVLKADAVGQAGARAKELRSGVDGRRKTLDLLDAGQPAAAQHVVLDSPFLIWTKPLVAVEDSTIEPWNSRAKIHFMRSNYSGGWGTGLLEDRGTEELSFYFLWDNPGEGWALVTIDGFLVLNGFCTANSHGGFWGGGSAGLGLDASLNILEWGNQPQPITPLPQEGQSASALKLEADSSGLFADDDTKYALVFRGFDLGYELLAVPPGDALVIDVALSISYDLMDGSVEADFATGDFDVMCPFVSIQVLAQSPTARAAPRPAESSGR
jgi:hypothetical protein